ncbi:GL14449, partial [Drosophila persimilis]
TQGAVEKMVSKCFEESITKMERLSSEMQLQEKMLNKMFRDINAKIIEQNDQFNSRSVSSGMIVNRSGSSNSSSGRVSSSFRRRVFNLDQKLQRQQLLQRTEQMRRVKFRRQQQSQQQQQHQDRQQQLPRQQQKRQQHKKRQQQQEHQQQLEG